MGGGGGSIEWEGKLVRIGCYISRVQVWPAVEGAEVPITGDSRGSSSESVEVGDPVGVD